MLDKAGDRVVLIFFVDPKKILNNDVFEWIIARASVNPEVVFLVIDSGNCGENKSEFDITSLPSVVFRKHRRTVLKFEGQDKVTMERFVTSFKTESTVVPVTDVADFEQFREKCRPKHVIVYFYSESCPASVLFMPVVQELANKNRDVAFVKVDKDRCPDMASRYSIDEVPKYVSELNKTKLQTISRPSSLELRESLEIGHNVQHTLNYNTKSAFYKIMDAR